MGTPEFALSSLRSLVEAGEDVIGVFTQPDQKQNRGMKLLAPPVKTYAEAQGIPVFQPQKLRDGSAMREIARLRPDLIVVAAYGRILPRDMLEYTASGCINVHSSLLPKYRGAAPIHHAILCGEVESGVTIMHMVEELDAGDIIMQDRTTIDPEETVASLHDRLALMGGALLLRAVEAIRRGDAPRTRQDSALVSYAPMLSRALSPLDFDKSAQELHDQVRGLFGWPCATAQLGDMTCKIWRSAVDETGSSDAPTGSIVSADATGICVVCGDKKLLRILELQRDGKKRMTAGDFLRGQTLPLYEASL